MTSDSDSQTPVWRERLDGERILWQGRPAQGMRLVRGDALMIPFSLMWGGFAFFWEASVLGLTGFGRAAPGPFSFFALWGVPFCLVGLYMIFGRFFYDAWRRGRTYYGVTDRRILIVRGSKVTALGLGNLGEINISAPGEGRGTITFGPETWGASGFGFRGRYAPPPSPAFEGIAEARKVYRLIQQAMADLRDGPKF